MASLRQIICGKHRKVCYAVFFNAALTFQKRKVKKIESHPFTKQTFASEFFAHKDLTVYFGAVQRSSFIAPVHICMTDTRNCRNRRDSNLTQRITTHVWDHPHNSSVHRAPGKKATVPFARSWYDPVWRQTPDLPEPQRRH